MQILFIYLLMYQMTPSLITTSTDMERLQAALLLVIHMISVLKVMELVLLMNVSRFCIGWTSLVWS